MGIEEKRRVCVQVRDLSVLLVPAWTHARIATASCWKGTNDWIRWRLQEVPLGDLHGLGMFFKD